MHRLLVDAVTLADDFPVLAPEQARHLKVLRPEDGERIELFDGQGRSRVYAFDASVRRLVAPAGSVAAEVPRPAPLTLFACVTKGSRWDWTVEKVTELGVTRIVPVISARTIVRLPMAERAAKRERWQRIAEDAARQSDAKWLPEILPATDFVDSLALVSETDCFVGALVTPPARPLAEAMRELHAGKGRPVAVFVGPEGDFTPEELASLMKVATPTSFGPTVLRAETAAVFAVSVLKGLTDRC